MGQFYGQLLTAAPGVGVVPDAGPRPVGAAAAAAAAELFRVLADPTRLRLLSVLAGRELCVNQLARALAMSQPAVSHHLRILRHMRVVSRERRGRRTFYRLDDDHVEALLAQALSHVAHPPAAQTGADGPEEADGG